MEQEKIASQVKPQETVGRTHHRTPLQYVIFSLLFLLILLTVLSGMALFFESKKLDSQPLTPQPTSSATSPAPDGNMANWKTYTNTKIGFEIKYPSSDKTPYIVSGIRGGQAKDVDGSEDNVAIHFPGSDPDLALAFTLELLPYEGKLNELPKLPAESRLYVYSETEKPPVLKETTLSNGTQTLWFKRTETSDERHIGQNRYEIYLVAKDHAFIFHTNYNLSETNIDQILSTFKFTQ